MTHHSQDLQAEGPRFEPVCSHREKVHS